MSAFQDELESDWEADEDRALADATEADWGVCGEVEGTLGRDLERVDDAENADDVPERLERVWSMFLRD